MAECYHERATFQDIAFRLEGKQQIHAMWHMICENGIEVEAEEPPKEIDDELVVRITVTYIFSDTKRRVVNPITCRFRLRDGLIIEHLDECDPAEWARQAMGGIKGWLAGRIGFLRRPVAKKKLHAFIAQHSEYA